MLTKILLSFFLLSFLIRTDFAFDQDLGRHIKLGEIIINTGQIPNTNLFSYTYPDFPFTNHHWLFEALAYLGDQSIGIGALLLIKLALFTVTLLIVLKINNSYGFFTLLLGFTFLHVVRERTDLRPEVFSFLFTSITYLILQKFPKLIYILPVIQLIWINMHIYFPIGLILQGIFLLDASVGKNIAKAKSLSLVLLLSLSASLINPNFINGLIYPLKIFGNYGYSIVENQSIFTLESLNFHNSNILFVKLIVVIIIISLIIGWIKQRLTLVSILISILGVGLALAHVRSLPYLFLLSFPAILNIFPNTKIKGRAGLIYGCVALILIYESVLYLNGNYYLQTNSASQSLLEAPQKAKRAMDFVLNNHLPQPIYNNFDIGSYIIYRGYPEYKVFVDGRPESYPAAFFQNEYIPSQSDVKKFDELDNKYHFQSIIFSHTDQTPWAKNFLKQIIRHESWVIVYLDDTMIVMIKTPVSNDLNLTPINLADINPRDYHFENGLSNLRLASFLFNIDYPKPANLFLERSKNIIESSIWW